MTLQPGTLLSSSLVFALLAQTAGAQTCRGRPGFTKTMVVANAGAMKASDARSMSAGATAGRPEGLLASAAIGYVVREASATFSTDQTGTSLGASVAYAGTEAGGRLELCPGLGFSRIQVSGDFFGNEATLTQTSRRAGLAAGYRLPATRDVLVIPFGSADYVWFDGSVRGEGIDLPVPEDTYIPISLGLGSVWKERIGFTMAVVIPTGLPTAHRAYVASFSVAVGGR